MSIKIVIYLTLLVWNLSVLITYGIDKSKAKRGAWRIPEKILLLESFFLGGLGALLAGQLFHHKTRKWYFHLVWYLGVVIACSVIYLVWRM